jgi:hypothetical protein
LVLTLTTTCVATGATSQSSTVSEPAAAWPSRWDLLNPFIVARYDGLPGRVFADESDRDPPRDEVGEHSAWRPGGWRHSYRPRRVFTGRVVVAWERWLEQR